MKYAIRIPASDSLEHDITELLTRPVARPSHKPVVWYEVFLYQTPVERQRDGRWRRWSPIVVRSFKKELLVLHAIYSLVTNAVHFLLIIVYILGTLKINCKGN